MIHHWIVVLFIAGSFGAMCCAFAVAGSNIEDQARQAALEDDLTRTQASIDLMDAMERYEGRNKR